MTEPGTPVRIPEDDSPTLTDPAGAPVRLTVQVVIVNEISEDGEQLTPLSATVGDTQTSVVFVTPFQEAVMVDDISAVTDAAVAVKLTEDAPAGTVTDAGTGSAAPDDSPIVAGTVVRPVRTAEQVVDWSDISVDGEQLTADKVAAGITATLVVRVTPFNLADTVTGVGEETVAAVAVNCPEDPPVEINTLAGTASAPLDDDRTINSPSGKVPLSVTWQVAVVRDTTVVGEQTIPVGVIAGETVTTVLLVTPFQVADMVAVESRVTEAAVAVKLAEVDPAGMLTDAGTGKALPDESPIVVT